MTAKRAFSQLILLITFAVFLAIGSIIVIYFLNQSIPSESTSSPQSKDREAPSVSLKEQSTLSAESVPNRFLSWATYKNVAGIQFQHPNLNDDCCGLSGPITGKADEAVVIFGNASGDVRGVDSSFDGFAVYIEPNSENRSF